MSNRRFDYDRVAPRLYQGGMARDVLNYDNFSMIVLCAQEWQPQLPQFRGTIIRGGYMDSTAPAFVAHATSHAEQYAAAATAALDNGARVLITCQMGWNRSGLCTAMVLSMRTDLSVEAIAGLIRAARGPDAMCNPAFNRAFVQWHNNLRRRQAVGQAPARTSNRRLI